MRLEHAVNVDDVRNIARRRLPRMIFDFIDGGAEDELTLQANRRAFDAVEFIPELMVGTTGLETASTVAGLSVSLPLILAPAGLTRVVHPDGELAVARAAAAKRIPYVIGAFSTFTIEELADSGADLWFETGPASDEPLRDSLIARAQRSNYGLLVYMADTPVSGRRERELRRGVAFPPRYSARNVLDGLTHPRWGLGWLRSAHKIAPRSVEGAETRRRLLPIVPSIAPFGGRLSNPAATWDDVRRVRNLWDGPFAVKGVMSAADAERAIEHGADVVMVSNHGGRQLDGLPAALSELQQIADVIGDRAELVVDGGIRRGAHIAKAVALGARACMIGRPYHFGLGAGGEAGVAHVIDLLALELERTMALLGRKSITQIDRSCIRTRPSATR